MMDSNMDLNMDLEMDIDDTPADLPPAYELYSSYPSELTLTSACPELHQESAAGWDVELGKGQSKEGAEELCGRDAIAVAPRRRR